MLHRVLVHPWHVRHRLKVKLGISLEQGPDLHNEALLQIRLRFTGPVVHAAPGHIEATVELDQTDFGTVSFQCSGRACVMVPTDARYTCWPVAWEILDFPLSHPLRVLVQGTAEEISKGHPQQ